MTQSDYKKLSKRGQQLFGLIAARLNTTSDKYIRKSDQDFRREVDFSELCLALALLEERLTQEH